MKVLVKGEAHKSMQYITECLFCDSRIRILKGDPMSTAEEWDGRNGRSTYRLNYICPVCGCQNEAAETVYASDHNVAKMKRENITLTKEDREEIASWKENNSESNPYRLSKDDYAFLKCYTRQDYWYRSAEEDEA